MNWDELFIRQADLIAEKSKDPSTKVGCVIVGEGNVVLSMGFNGFARGVMETEDEWYVRNQREALEQTPFDRWVRPEKYVWVEHAERNAIYNAARHGIKLEGARLYVNCDLSICADCARAIIQSGIKEVVGVNRPFTGVGAGVHYHTDRAGVMLAEAGVKQRKINVTSG